MKEILAPGTLPIRRERAAINIDDFRLLYDFNAWANHRTLDACAGLAPEQFTRDLGSSFRSLRDTFAHIYGAEWVWLERWHGRVPTALPSAADFPDFESVQRRLSDMDRNLVDYVASLTADELKYTNPTAATGATVEVVWKRAK